MIAGRARFEPYSLAAGDLGWICRSMVFSWRGSEVGSDAAALFADVFGHEATSTQRNKFSTASMPCRSWAGGISDGLTVDLSIGVDDDHSQMRLLAKIEGEPMPGALKQLRSRVEKLEVATTFPLIGCRAALDLELPDKVDRADFTRWLGQEDWQAQARLFKQEYIFLLRDGGIEVSVAALVDRRSDYAELGIGAGAAGISKEVTSGELFDALSVLLSLRRIKDFPSV